MARWRISGKRAVKADPTNSFLYGWRTITPVNVLLAHRPHLGRSVGFLNHGADGLIRITFDSDLGFRHQHGGLEPFSHDHAGGTRRYCLFGDETCRGDRSILPNVAIPDCAPSKSLACCSCQVPRRRLS